MISKTGKTAQVSIFDRMAKNTVMSPTAENYTARKMNKLLIHTKAWMTLKKLKLCEEKKNEKFYMNYTLDFIYM